MNNIQKTTDLGQSIWLDYILRSFITSGELVELVDSGLAGMTSNPAIFDKAISGSTDYDISIKTLIEEGLSTIQVYDELTREDIGMAADLLRPVYERTGGHDGYVSLEVNPHLAYDTDSTVKEGVRLFTTLNRPNVMIKVPATNEGIAAVEELIRKGINVNVTLIFSLLQYQDAAQAYIVGLKRRAAEDRPIDTIASVASFFVSRVDTAVDQILTDTGCMELIGRTAISNAKLAYARFKQIFSGHDWENLASKGARLQRPLWASTSTKNANLPDTLYVDTLIGPHTVNTLPMKTLKAFQDHGIPSVTLPDSLSDASRHMEQLQECGIEIDVITDELLIKGVDLFTSSFDSLIDSISRKTAKLISGRKDFFFSAPGYADQIEFTLELLENNNVISRIQNLDHSLWGEDPKEISDRLGWLDSPMNMKDALGQIRDLSDKVRAEGYTDALLLGMGGSSLAPDLFRKTFGARRGYLDLRVLDSTDPAAIREQTQLLDPLKTLFIVSTKSGTTSETLSLFRYFFNLTAQTVGYDTAGNHFIAITDPGSPLQSMALELGFREIFLNDPKIGGRYSALSFFGLVPAKLLGIDIDLILERAAAMAALCFDENSSVREENPGAVLGGILGACHNSGADKLTFIISPPIVSIGAWLEQLIAESTGKDGKGILPVDGELPGKPEIYGDDRLFVYLKLSGDSTYDSMVEALEKDGKTVVHLKLADFYDIGTEYFRWEIATVIAGHVMGINPFDQPNVESAKNQARQMLNEYRASGRLPVTIPDLTENRIEVYSGFQAANLEDSIQGFLSQVRPGDYIALQAYLNPIPEIALALGELRHAIREKYHVATTVGFGPRFLHSTGQLHKGDSGSGLFIQVTADDSEDIPIPDEPGKEGSSITFGILKAAQAMGDRQALIETGRRVIRLHLKRDIVAGLRLIKEKMG